MSPSLRNFRRKHFVTLLLFLMSGIALFYTGLDYTLGTLWNTERDAGSRASGISAMILIFSMVMAVFVGLQFRSAGSDGNRGAIIVLGLGLFAAAVPLIVVN